MYIQSNLRLARMVDAYDWVLGGHNEPLAEAADIPRVSEAFRDILGGRGQYAEGDGLRRYTLDGFDILIRLEAIEARR